MALHSAPRSAACTFVGEDEARIVEAIVMLGDSTPEDLPSDRSDCSARLMNV